MNTDSCSSETHTLASNGFRGMASNIILKHFERCVKLYCFLFGNFVYTMGLRNRYFAKAVDCSHLQKWFKILLEI